jgi:large repetitive protein
MYRRKVLMLLAALLAIGVVALFFREQKHTRPLARARIVEPKAPPTLSNAQEGGTSLVLRGRVLSKDSGRVIASAQVCTAPTTCRTTVRCGTETCSTTGTYGSFELEVVKPGSYDLTASAANFMPGRAEAIVVLHSKLPTRVEIGLQPGQPGVEGIVRDVLGGEVPRATVKQVLFDGAQSRSRTEADAAGHFLLPVAPGYAILIATADGYAPVRKTVVAPAKGVQLVMTPGGSIVGRVVSAADDRPLPGLNVRASRHNLPHDVGEESYAATGADGSFEMHDLAPGTHLLRATSEQWRAEASVGIELEVGDRVDGVVLQAHRATQMRGRFVRVPDGEPCTAGQIELRRADTGVPTHLLDLDTDGLLLVEGLLPGAYQVDALCGHHRLHSGPTRIEVDDRDLTDLVWKFDGGNRIWGSIADEDGRPWASVAVVVKRAPEAGDGEPWMSSVLTGSRGEFEFLGLPDGHFSVEAAGVQDTERATLELNKGTPEAKVRLRIGGSAKISLQVHNARGIPVSDVSVYATREQQDEEASGPLARAYGADRGGGSFSIGPISSGAYQVYVTDGQNPRSMSRISLRSGEHATLDVTYGSHTGTLAGVIVSPEGAPIANAWVRTFASELDDTNVTPLLGQSFETLALSDHEGRFEVGGLDNEASYTLQVTAPGGARITSHDARPGQLVTIVASAKGAGTDEF